MFTVALLVGTWSCRETAGFTPGTPAAYVFAPHGIFKEGRLDARTGRFIGVGGPFRYKTTADWLIFTFPDGGMLRYRPTFHGTDRLDLDNWGFWSTDHVWAAYLDADSYSCVRIDRGRRRA